MPHAPRQQYIGNLVRATDPLARGVERQFMLGDHRGERMLWSQRTFRRRMRLSALFLVVYMTAVLCWIVFVWPVNAYVRMSTGLAAIPMYLLVQWGRTRLARRRELARRVAQSDADFLAEARERAPESQAFALPVRRAFGRIYGVDPQLIKTADNARTLSRLGGGPVLVEFVAQTLAELQQADDPDSLADGMAAQPGEPEDVADLIWRFGRAVAADTKQEAQPSHEGPIVKKRHWAVVAARVVVSLLLGFLAVKSLAYAGLAIVVHKDLGRSPSPVLHGWKEIAGVVVSEVLAAALLLGMAIWAWPRRTAEPGQ